MNRAVKINKASQHKLRSPTHSPRTRRGFAGLLTVFAIILNLLSPLTHSVAMTAEGAEFVEICTSGGIEYVRMDHFNTDKNLADEECPICAECPVCWMSNPASALANDQQTVRAGHNVSHDHYFTYAHSAVERQSWSWPESRAPPKLKLI